LYLRQDLNPIYLAALEMDALPLSHWQSLTVSSTIKIEQILISLIIGSSEGRFRSRDERKGAEKM
jgi:hypothetical protein